MSTAGGRIKRSVTPPLPRSRIHARSSGIHTAWEPPCWKSVTTPGYCLLLLLRSPNRSIHTRARVSVCVGKLQSSTQCVRHVATVFSLLLLLLLCSSLAQLTELGYRIARLYIRACRRVNYYRGPATFLRCAPQDMGCG